MRNTIRVFGISFIMLFSMVGFSQSMNTQTIQDTAKIMTETFNVNNYNENDDDTFFKAGLFTIMIFFLIGFCILTILCVAITTFILLVMIGLGLAGIISTSILFGLYKKSFKKGIKLFTVLGFSFCGFIGGAIVFALANKITHWMIFQNALLFGGGIGILSGIITGLIFFSMFRLLIRMLSEKLNLKSKGQ